MTTITAMIFYVCWRLWEDRKARHAREITARDMQDLMGRTKRIETALGNTPFLNFNRTT